MRNKLVLAAALLASASIHATTASAAALAFDYTGEFTDSVNPYYFKPGAAFTGSITVTDSAWTEDQLGYWSLRAANVITMTLKDGSKTIWSNPYGSLNWDSINNILYYGNRASAAGMGSTSIQMTGIGVPFLKPGSPPSLPTNSDALRGKTGTLSFYGPALYGGVAGSGYVSFGSAVPEPASWALMIGGIGLAGGMMRRQRAREVTYA